MYEFFFFNGSIKAASISFECYKQLDAASNAMNRIINLCVPLAYSQYLFASSLAKATLAIIFHSKKPIE